jgi:hypothetical protein
MCHILQLCQSHSMFQPDELEYLRAILAHSHDIPRKANGVRTIVRRIAKGFFVTPKEVIMKRVLQNRPANQNEHLQTGHGTRGATALSNN